ncbi:MAG: prepilin-type N-terminal cleavage/methylation domain-containing protein [Bacilli bacterium]|nr:prepilin-type N-terminal cleavage/methylation domain-containing protein [Bacilli bacterium]
MNKKGMTLIELIVSIAMLSVALVFMYGLMTNLQRKKNDNDAYTDNIMKIVDIETKIQNVLMDDFEFGREEDISEIRLWNDIWLDEDDKKSSQYIRLDVKLDGIMYEKAIGVSNKGRMIMVREKLPHATGVEKEWKNINVWNFGEEVKSVKISENCSWNKPSLHCQINIYLFDDSNKIIDSINVPFYFVTDKFIVNNNNHERLCNLNNSLHLADVKNCPGGQPSNFVNGVLQNYSSNF